MSFDHAPSAPYHPPSSSTSTMASADPFVGVSCLDFLLIELVPMADRIVSELDRAATVAAAAAAAASTSQIPPTSSSSQHQASSSQQQPQQQHNHSQHSIRGAGTGGAESHNTAKTGGGGGASVTAADGDDRAGGEGEGEGEEDEEQHRDAVFWRLDALGYRVGQGLVERFSRERPRFNDTLDVIKFLCKDLWTLVFRKQIDNLKTNHRGVFVLTDNAFRPFGRMSTEPGGKAVARAQPFLWFPCGVVRGALAALGVSATVQAETSELPAAIFQIKTTGAK